MAAIKNTYRIHLDELKLADFLDGKLTLDEKKEAEGHIASCDDCLAALVTGYESVKEFNYKKPRKKRNGRFMKKINLYLVGAVIAFTLSFITPGHFIQLLIVTLILGIKWVSDSRSTKMLVMIYEAWKSGGEKEASRVMESLDPLHKGRF